MLLVTLTAEAFRMHVAVLHHEESLFFARFQLDHHLQ